MDAVSLHLSAAVTGKKKQARNALLAAYYVLDEDGAMGLSKEQLVGVLTTKAGVGVDRGQVGTQTLLHYRGVS